MSYTFAAVTPNLRKMLLVSACLFASFTSIQAQANCDLKHTLCETGCKIEHFDAGAAQNGCFARCATDTASCQAQHLWKEGKQGAQDLLEAGRESGQEVLNSSRQFAESFTQD